MTDGIQRRLASACTDVGLPNALGRWVEPAVGDSRVYSNLRWRLASRYYRATCANDVREYDAAPDPFKLEAVDPDAIRRNTRRPYPAWRDRHEDFGAVRGGDWDRRRRPDVDPEYDGTPPDLYLADRFEETTLYRALEAHFERGVPWDDTEFVTEVRRLLETGRCQQVWNGCRSVEEIRDRCRSLDRLYETIRRSGYRSQRELVAADSDATFRDWIREEVLVDVGRDGDLLLVNGRHRLSLARLLGIDRIPVLFVVRHLGWMARREAAAAGVDHTFAIGEPAASGGLADHPDLRDVV
ncbi:MAG: hypothetical protein ACOCZD_01490 [Haloferacaceae archaeon]